MFIAMSPVGPEPEEGRVEVDLDPARPGPELVLRLRGKAAKILYPVGFAVGWLAGYIQGRWFS